MLGTGANSFKMLRKHVEGTGGVPEVHCKLGEEVGTLKTLKEVKVYLKRFGRNQETIKVRS